MTDDEPGVYYSPQQVADKLAVKPITILRYIAQGKLKASRINNKTVRISHGELQRFMEAT